MLRSEIEDIISGIITDEGNSKYFIHRTNISPVFYDVSNGRLYTDKEYFEMCRTSETSSYADEYLYAIADLELEELTKKHFLDVGAGWTISEEEYRTVYEKNIQEQLNEFFENGLYAVETSIERTATSLEEGPLHQILSHEEQKQRLNEILGKVGFGMNTGKGNGLLGALANREELNTLLILEIPETCFGDIEQITKLFEKSDSVLEMMTAYRGLQKLDTVIPKEFIKGAFSIQGETIIYNENEHYRSDKNIENGIYNNQTVKGIIESLLGYETVQSNEIRKILEIIQSDFSIDNDEAKLKSRMSKVESLLEKVEDKDSVESLSAIIEEIYENIRNPLEKEYRKIMQLDFSQLSADEITQYIQDFVLHGSETLRNLREKKAFWEFDSMLEMYEEGLEVLSQDALDKIQHDYRANNAFAMVNRKLADIKSIDALKKKIDPLDELDIFGELPDGDREEFNNLLQALDDAKAKICVDDIVDLEKGAFLAETIGKSTINISTQSKDVAKDKVYKDEKSLEQTPEIKSE